MAAHSCFGGERFGNSRDLAAFLAGEDITAERHRVGGEERIEESVMLALRLTKGVDLSRFRQDTGEDFFKRYPGVKQYVWWGYMTEREGHISFTDKGFFVSNTILSEMLTLS